MRIRNLGFLMTVIASAIAVVLVPFIDLRIDRSVWETPLLAAVVAAPLVAVARLVTYRLRDDDHWMGQLLRGGADRLEHLVLSSTILLGGTTAVIVLVFQTAAAASPFQDATFAAIDQAMFIDWMGVSQWVYDHPTVTWMMVKAYYSSMPQLMLLVTAFVVLGRTVRLYEFTAHYVLASIFTAFVAGAFPAAGAYTHYQPGPEFTEAFTNAGTVHIDQLMALRSGALNELVMDKVVGMVTFPSFHTILALLVIWSSRSTWWFYPAVIVNLVVIASTLPVGGHHFVDVLAGSAVAATTIALVRAWRGVPVIGVS